MSNDPGLKNISFLDRVNMSRITEDIYLEVKMLWEELRVAQYPEGKKTGHSFNPATIAKILSVLELKYDLDETVQAKKQALMRALLKVNSRRLMEEYVKKLSADQSTL